MSADTLITKCTPHQKYDQWKGRPRTQSLAFHSSTGVFWWTPGEPWRRSSRQGDQIWTAYLRGTATVLPPVLGYKSFLFFFSFLNFLKSKQTVLCLSCLTVVWGFYWFAFFFSSAVIYFNENSIPQTKRKKKCPVKILERLLLWLRSIEKANCVFLPVSVYALASCHMLHPGCELLHVPFPCHAAHPCPSLLQNVLRCQTQELWIPGCFLKKHREHPVL